MPNKLKKRTQRNKRRDSSQDIKKDSESETAGKHTGKLNLHFLAAPSFTALHLLSAGLTNENFLTW